MKRARPGTDIGFGSCFVYVSIRPYQQKIISLYAEQREVSYCHILLNKLYRTDKRSILCCVNLIIGIRLLFL